MYRELVEVNGVVLANSSVIISTEIQRAQEGIGQTSVYRESLASVDRYASENGRLKKSELRAIWSDKQISFASKCLITLWWGHPSHFVSQRVYSQANIDILSRPEVETSFHELVSITDFRQFLSGLEALYKKFESGGAYHLAGINTAFFTKLFHFYFDSHPIVSNPDFLPVIADRWMKLAVYAEMADCQDARRFELFTIRQGKPRNIDFHYGNGSSATAYVEFVTYYNSAVSRLKTDYPEITPFILEDVLFAYSQSITPLFVHKDHQSLFLPPWVAGRYNETAQAAIAYNNILGVSYLFEGGSAQVIGEILKTEYWAVIDVDAICSSLQCTECELLAFMVELKDQTIITDHVFNSKEIYALRKQSAKNKRCLLRQSKGTENLQTVFELADTDYRDIIEKQNIPLSVSFELTYGCNEMCVHCYNPGSTRLECVAKKVSADELTYEDYCRLLDQVAEMGVPKLLFTGGDPFVKRDFIKILQYAHHKKFAVSIYTNGQALYNHPQYYQEVTDCYPYSVGLSLYSVNPEIHESITRVKGSCEKTKNVARRFSEDGMNILIKCPIMRVNKDGYHDIYKFAIAINAVPEFEVNITSSVDGDNYAVEHLRLSEEEMTALLKDPMIPLSTERKNASRLIERSPEMQFCGAGIDGMNIKPNGEVTPCLAFTASCGNVREQTFKEIWKQSDVLKRIRTLTYADSDRCGKESYCKYCNRCIGQSYSEHGVPENMSTDNCFIAKIREKIDSKNKEKGHLLKV